MVQSTFRCIVLTRKNIAIMYTLEEIEQMIKNDQIIDSKILAVLTLYKNKIL